MPQCDIKKFGFNIGVYDIMFYIELIILECNIGFTIFYLVRGFENLGF